MIFLPLQSNQVNWWFGSFRIHILDSHCWICSETARKLSNMWSLHACFDLMWSMECVCLQHVWFLLNQSQPLLFHLLTIFRFLGTPPCHYLEEFQNDQNPGTNTPWHEKLPDTIYIPLWRWQCWELWASVQSLKKVKGQIGLEIRPEQFFSTLRFWKLFYAHNYSYFLNCNLWFDTSWLLLNHHLKGALGPEWSSWGLGSLSRGEGGGWGCIPTLFFSSFQFSPRFHLLWIPSLITEHIQTSSPKKRRVASSSLFYEDKNFIVDMAASCEPHIEWNILVFVHHGCELLIIISPLDLVNIKMDFFHPIAPPFFFGFSVFIDRRDFVGFQGLGAVGSPPRATWSATRKACGWRHQSNHGDPQWLLHFSKLLNFLSVKWNYCERQELVGPMWRFVHAQGFFNLLGEVVCVLIQFEYPRHNIFPSNWDFFEVKAKINRSLRLNDPHSS